MKRLFDLIFAAAVLLAFSPVMLLLCASVLLTCGRPIMFRQQRPGLHGRPFTLMKFRTMRAPRFNGESDAARLTWLGKILRSTSLDELPTLWNVVKGELSIVGPRPLLMRYLDRYTPEQARRHEVRPGITGWAQVSGRNALAWEQKFALDIWYVDNQSVLLDLKIITMTLKTVILRTGIAHEGEATMPEFLGSSHGDDSPGHRTINEGSCND